jgi:glutathione peroxidase
MLRTLALSLRTLALSLLAFAAVTGPAAAGGSAHDFSFTAIEGGPLPLAQFKGRTVLVVNTASLCGYTPQYAALESLWQRYRDRGLVVLGVPSNDFGGQEPGSATEIKQFCETNYAVNFPLTAKVAVSGAGAHPFYKWAATELGQASKPRWNFHKYLVGPDGRLVAWFPTATEPGSETVTKAIEAALPEHPPSQGEKGS